MRFTEIFTFKRVARMAAIAAALLCSASCYEDYIGDYDYPNMGFALSRQVRTVMSKTNQIYVGVSIGGLREVDMDAWAQFSLDQSLLKGLPYTLLPENYYELSDPAMMTVRKSNLMVADVGIKFTDAFYADPAARKATYALPLRIVAASIKGPDANGNIGEYGSIREGGETAVIVIKYASSYSGTYYRLGEVVETDEYGEPVAEPVSFTIKELMNNKTFTLSSEGPSSVSFQGVAAGADAQRQVTTAGGKVTLSIDPDKGLNDDADVEFDSDMEIVSATVRWVRNGDYTFYSGDNPAPQFNLDYTYINDGRYYHATEKLVLRKWAEEELRVEVF